jgi:hypothetical protein
MMPSLCMQPQPHCERQNTRRCQVLKTAPIPSNFYLRDGAGMPNCRCSRLHCYCTILVSLTQQGKSFGEAVGILFGIIVGVGSFLWCVKWFCTYKVGSSDDDAVAEVPVSNAPTMSVTAHRQTFTHTHTDGTTTHTHKLSHTHTVTQVV